MKRLVTNIQFWIWAAMHSRRFNEFQIGFTRLIKIRANYTSFSYERLIISISLYVPLFVYKVNYVDAKNYGYAANVHVEDLFGFDDIPF